jgi:hypothetical protein
MSSFGVAETLKEAKTLVDEGIFHYDTRDEVPQEISKYEKSWRLKG